jgi:hypothetical protein
MRLPAVELPVDLGLIAVDKADLPPIGQLPTVGGHRSFLRPSLIESTNYLKLSMSSSLELPTGGQTRQPFYYGTFTDVV